MQLPWSLSPSFFHMYEGPDYALQSRGWRPLVLFAPAVMFCYHHSSQPRSASLRATTGMRGTRSPAC